MIEPTKNLLESCKTVFALQQMQFDHQAIKYLTRKETLKERLHGFLTRGYYQREKLAREGMLFWAYTFKTFLPRATSDEPYFSWAIFSPELAFEEEPKLLEAVSQKLQQFAEAKPRNLKERKLYNAVNVEVAEPKYVLLPSSISDGHIIYLQYIEVFPDQIMNFKLGFNLIIALPSKSKDVMYLPRRYWAENYLEQYDK